MCHDVPYCAVTYSVPNRKDAEEKKHWNVSSDGLVSWLSSICRICFHSGFNVHVFFDTHACFGTVATFDIGTCKSNKINRESPRSFAGSYNILPPERFFHGRFSRFSPQALTRCICEGSNVIHRLRLGRPFHHCCCELTRLATLVLHWRIHSQHLDQKLEIVKMRRFPVLSAVDICWSWQHQTLFGFVFIILIAKLWHAIAKLWYCMRTFIVVSMSIFYQLRQNSHFVSGNVHSRQKVIMGTHTHTHSISLHSSVNITEFCWDQHMTWEIISMRNGQTSSQKAHHSQLIYTYLVSLFDIYSMYSFS